jgi:activator of HSP90 ATPase
VASLKRVKKFQWSLTSETSPETTALFALAKSKLPTALEAKLATFPVDLIDTHGKDIIVGSNEPSRTSSPAPPPASAPASSGGPGRAKKAVPPSQKINTSTVNVEATFQASADDLFSLLTDEKRIPMWSRAQAKVSLGGLEKLRVDVFTPYGRAQLRQIQSMSYLEAACVASTSHLRPARKSSRPGHCKARPGQRVKL